MARLVRTSHTLGEVRVRVQVGVRARVRARVRVRQRQHLLYKLGEELIKVGHPNEEGIESTPRVGEVRRRPERGHLEHKLGVVDVQESVHAAGEERVRPRALVEPPFHMRESNARLSAGRHRQTNGWSRRGHT
jgi:hypothetical protein